MLGIKNNCFLLVQLQMSKTNSFLHTHLAHRLHFVLSSCVFFFSSSADMSDAAIMELNLPTGIPIVYELDKDLKPVKPMQFLGDEETVRKAMEAVAAQGKVKK